MESVEKERDELLKKLKIVEDQRDDLLKKGRMVESERNDFLRNNKIMEMQRDELEQRYAMAHKNQMELKAAVRLCDIAKCHARERCLLLLAFNRSR